MSGKSPSPVKVHPSEHAHSANELPGIVLPRDRWEWVEAWGMSGKSMAHVWRPTTVEGIHEVFELARKTGRTVAFRGGGNSYGDAFQNAEEIVLDLGRMNRVLAWNPETGVIDMEPGVRIADLWKYIIEDGWWPPVVSGTMFTTMGGCAAMNIHGKNAWKMGPFGEHVLEFEMVLPNGEHKTASPTQNSDLFYSAISGFGMIGCFTRIRMKMKKIYSGNVRVWARRTETFPEMIEAFEENANRMDYMVGWIDAFPKRERVLGRGEMHFAKYLKPGEDGSPAQSLRVCNQELPDMLMGFLPKSIMYKLMKPWINDLGMRAINTAKYNAQRKPGSHKPYLQSHAGFAFLLDYVPNWKESYRPGGLIQYQTFVPKEHAARVFREQIRLSHKRGIVPYLGVTKKHRPDPFLLTHAVDGFSMALDYRVTAGNRKALWKLCHEMDEMVLDAGGRFYFAKDSTMREGTVFRYIPPENIEKFLTMKQKCDPEGLLSSNLYRRVFGDNPHERLALLKRDGGENAGLIASTA